jgi:hypothetical protein
MDLHERQQFDFLLQVAVERYVERVEQTGEDRVKLEDFTNAIFSDFLLDNADGACFVLRALAKQDKVEVTLITMAKAVFSDLLRRKVGESLEQRAGY